MKKIFIALFVLFLAAPTFGVEVDLLTKQGALQKKLSEIGFKLLNANKIPYKIMFYYKPSTKKQVNACAYYRNGQISFYEGLMAYMESDDEIAAILGHEISHAVDYRQGFANGFFSFIPSITTYNTRRLEYKADKRAIDYMVNAGYNPVAFIVAQNKFMSQRRFDVFDTHPLTTRRMMEIYEYIYKKYPQYLINNPYQNNVYYQNFLLVSQENRKKLQEKLKSNSKQKIHYE